MEPIPETTDAVQELDALAVEDDLLERLVAESEQVRAVVPECVAMSVTMLEPGITFTFLAAAVERIASSLSLPLTHDGTTSGGVDLYATDPQAFRGHHEQLADILGASAGGAVADSDLGFRTQDAARQAPRIVRDATTVEVATGMLAAILDISVDDAQGRLTRTARRAGVLAPALARAVADLVRGDTDPP